MHWKHSKYQILHTIVANCHTYDEAYRVLRELEEDYDLSIKLASAEYKRINSKEIAAQTILDDESETPYNKLGAEADLATVKARHPSVQDCADVAVSTLRFIRQCIEVISPLRMYSDLPDAEAHQRCQYLEWKLDLIWKSYNMICAAGAMSYDHYINIKMHPESAQLFPVITEFLTLAREGNHSALLALTKADVFAKVVNTDETFIPSVSTVFAGIQHDSLIPKLKN